ncbi:hypothetical protein AUJ68_05230 [Candidatus Woesearchaeota archaeon CG1_02_57_44]|nr:MAG: hypothetical protein AUJ68_05230 [Candidatus Woesearchaeota archaeon CG1_02_57_44]
MTWTIEDKKTKPRLKRPILIEGLPGIGNVGKIAVDYLIDELRAEKYCSFFAEGMSHSVYVNEENLIEMPQIELYYKKNGRQDLLLLCGDVQPPDEISAHHFCEKVLDVFGSFDGQRIITIGGIGLQEVPTNSKIYCTGNNAKAVKEFTKDTKARTDIYGVVGPIIGVSGMLLGLGQRRKIPAVALLAETFGHPMYVGLKEARAVIKLLATKLNLDVNLKDLNKEIRRIDKEIMKAEQMSQQPPAGSSPRSTSYIG